MTQGPILKRAGLKKRAKFHGALRTASAALRSGSREVRSRKHGLRLVQGLDLLAHGLLANIEVLEREIAALVKVSSVRRELFQLRHSGLVVLLRLSKALLGLRLVLRHVDDGLLSRSDRVVRVLHERFVRALGVLLSLDRLRLHDLGIRDDALHHGEDTAGALVLLVSREARRRRRRVGPRLLLRLRLRLDEAVHFLEAVEGLRQDRLRGALVGDGLLELLVLHLAVLTRALDLHLHLRDLGLLRLDVLGQGVNRRLQVFDVRLEVGLLVLRDHGGLLVLRELLRAVVLVLDVVGELLLEISDHLVDGGDDLGESVEAGARRQREELRAASLLRRRLEHRNGLLARLLVHVQDGVHLDEAERAREEVAGLVRREDGDGLADRGDLGLARLGALLHLRVRHAALLLEVQEELLVRRERVARVREVLLRLRALLIGLRELDGLHVNRLLGGADLGELGRLELVVGVLGGELVLLRLREVRLEGLLHLLEDAEDGAGLRRVRLVAGRLLHEGRKRALLVRRNGALQHARVVVEVVADHGRDGHERLRRHLHLGVVLAEDGDRVLERLDRLHHVLLLRVELLQLLLANRRRLVEGLLVLRDLLVQSLDLSVEARALRGKLLNRRHERSDALLGNLNRRCLLLVVRLAPARELV